MFTFVSVFVLFLLLMLKRGEGKEGRSFADLSLVPLLPSFSFQSLQSLRIPLVQQSSYQKIRRLQRELVLELCGRSEGGKECEVKEPRRTDGLWEQEERGRGSMIPLDELLQDELRTGIDTRLVGAVL